MTLPLHSFAGIFLVLAVGSPIAKKAMAREWTIPVAGNSFQSDVQSKAIPPRRDHSVVLNSSSPACTAYFRTSGSCELELSIQAESNHAATISASTEKQTFTTDLQPKNQTISLGTVKIDGAKYVPLELKLTATSTPVVLKNVVVQSDSEDLSIAFVKNNKGNMFYWGRRGPSVHLRYEVPRQSTLRYAYSELTIAEGMDPIGSYFMANGFAEGYFGIQVNSATERRVLFSVWSPFKTDNPRDIPEDQRIKTLARGKHVQIKAFGNEGSGGQSYLVYPWKAGETYRFLTEVIPDGNGNTRYTSWFSPKPTENSPAPWQLIASFLRPKTNTDLRGFHSFLENFVPSMGNQERRVSYSNVWVGATNGNWFECTAAKFSVDATGRGGHRLDFAGGATDRSFYLRNCGFFPESGRPGERFVRQTSGADSPAVDLSDLPRQSAE